MSWSQKYLSESLSFLHQQLSTLSLLEELLQLFLLFTENGEREEKKGRNIFLFCEILKDETLQFVIASSADGLRKSRNVNFPIKLTSCSNFSPGQLPTKHLALYFLSFATKSLSSCSRPRSFRKLMTQLRFIANQFRQSLNFDFPPEREKETFLLYFTFLSRQTN